MTWSAAVAAVIVGLLLSTRTVRARTGPWTLDLHRFLGGLTIVFLGTVLKLQYYMDQLNFVSGFNFVVLPWG